MKFHSLFLSAACLATGVLAQQEAAPPLGDSAIRRVEDCVCYASVEGQNLKPWEFAWDNPEKLRSQVSHCVCKVHIDVSRVANPSRYIVPGTVVK